MSFNPLYVERNIPFSALTALKEMERMVSFNAQPSYPPYNLVRTGSESFTLEFAVAGFAKKDVRVSRDGKSLTVSGSKDEKPKETREYLHKGIGMRKFSRTFSLPEYFEVTGAKMSDGILVISLERQIPEDKKPVDIAIK